MESTISKGGEYTLLNIAFCHDDKDFLDNITLKAAEIFKHLKIDVSINAFTDGNALIETFQKYQPYYDIIFLDIDMLIINGKDIAKKLRTMDKQFKLIFVTDYENEALNTFQYDVTGFIPKIHIEFKLFDLIERIYNAIDENDPRMQFFKVATEKEGFMWVRIPLNNLMYFESINRKVYLHTERETFVLHRYKYSEILKQYIPLGFVDIHRTCIVNMKYIFSVDNNEIRLDNGTRLPISRRKKQQIFDKFSEIIRKESIS